MHLIVAFDAMSRDPHNEAMARPDLNLLVALDILLEEGNVAAAARRMRLSASAMSRTLARLRTATGDPLLVRAGRGLVATPRAAELRERVAQLVHDAEAVLKPAEEIDIATIERTFTLRTSEGFVENFGPALIQRVSAEAPRVRLTFVQKVARDSRQLREGTVDLETGVVGKTTGPEVRTQALFRDRFIGVVRAGHALSKGRVTAARYAKEKHVETLNHAPGPIDERLSSLGLQREIAVIVGGFSTAIALARSSDYIATVPERHTGNLRAGMDSFDLPFPTRGFTVSMLWHPRLDADPAHRWLRRCVREACASDYSDSSEHTH
jgi:DNA-binding transcriptional LysR family regulator